MDIFDTTKRSAIMKLIKSKNSKAEVMVFRYLRKEGIYFQKHYKRAPGSPDIALPRRKKAVFIDGDFWHGRTYQRLVERRKDDDDYWVVKIKRNMDRDVLNQFDRNDFHVLHSSQTDDQEYILTVSRVKRD